MKYTANHFWDFAFNGNIPSDVTAKMLTTAIHSDNQSALHIAFKSGYFTNRLQC